ncbi:hypothetical protein pCPXV0084 [Cowpox virus]|uniref:Uncharacterized 7.5 kDa protein n=7 Tax=Orthopoxvirus TaxID=10242 RepID=YVAK_VACCC|nr:RecName: Full=Uncharacterized 7.5 kDa protein [Vaccinia virus Copenhagen]AAF34034.1 unknown [Vaccinia virus Tian Tan]AAG37641.1 CMP146.5R [Camelpox virus CMS]AAW23584.1 hypothetical protein m8194R [Vaccinia virus]ABZ80108.1 unknown [synthetic Vaccinia virus]UEC93254.1 hypothetical protein pCPXV0084 [Camelpox virus]CAB5514145.1 hypothetical protein pCPXV0084 [Cowpox virus]BBD06234.1 putative A ORF K [BAC cloning vector pLC16m8.8S-BAC]
MVGICSTAVSHSSLTAVDVLDKTIPMFNKGHFTRLLNPCLINVANEGSSSTTIEFSSRGCCMMNDGMLFD